MTLKSYIAQKNYNYAKSTNVASLINQVKSNQKKEKINNILITVAAISALVVSGIVISL